MHLLDNLWLDLRQKAVKMPAPLLLHTIWMVSGFSGISSTSFKTIWVDNEEQRDILNFVERFQQALIGQVNLRDDQVFDEFGITAEVEKRCKRGPAIRRIHRDQPDRGAGGDRHQYGQVRGQIQSHRRHHRQDQHGCH